MLEERVEVWKEQYIQQGRGLGRKEGRREGRKEGRKEGLEKGLEKGRKEGLAKGRQEGRQEGQRDGAYQAVCDVLEARFGTVPPLVSQALSGISDAEALRKLTRRASTVPSLQEFVALLEEGQKG